MPSARALRKQQVLLSILTTAVIAAAVCAAHGYGLFQRPDALLYDVQVTLRGPVAPSGSIVLVLLDETSAGALGNRRRFWRRPELADALSHLCAAGAEVVGIDLLLSAPDSDPAADEGLAEAIDRCNNVVLARVAASPEGQILPLTRFHAAAVGDGFIDLPTDRDDVLRRLPYLHAQPLADGGLQLIPAFSLELVRTFRNIAFEFDFSDPRWLVLGSLGGHRLRLPQPELIIHFYGDHTVFPTLSYTDVVHDRFAAADVRGKLVIIGSGLAIQKDFFSTPFSRFSDAMDAYADRFGKIVGGFIGKKDLGVSCHAQAAETLLSEQFVRKLPNRKLYAAVWITALLGTLCYVPWVRMRWSVLLLLAGVLAVFGIAAGLFRTQRLWLEASPLLAVIGLQFVAGILLQKVFDRKQVALITGLFGKYVSPRVVDELITDDAAAALDGQRREVTILFSDLRGFTTLSESLGARATSRLLNTYFDAMIPLLFAHEGTLDKLMGDAVMAFFGAPLTVEHHPARAAEAALAMLDAIERLKETSSVDGVHALEAGIGLSTGEVTVGNLGSHAFMDYTIIGDAVNLASRLEGLNKVYRTRILASASTASGLDDRFLLREVDRVRVKGKHEAVAVFELVGRTGACDDRWHAVIRKFDRGLQDFRLRRWDGARQAFEAVLEWLPDDGPATLYLERIAALESETLPEDWDGTTTFDHK